MKHIKRVLLSSFMGATVITGIVAGTAFPILSNQSKIAATQNSSETQSSSENSVPSVPSVNNDQNQSQSPTQVDWSKIFVSQKVSEVKANTNLSDAINQIKTIDDLWNFYAEPIDLPTGHQIQLDSVEIYTDITPLSNQALLVTLKIDNNQDVKFLIYGFLPYSANDYKMIFESANSHGVVNKINDENEAYKDPADLSTDPKSVNYFANYYTPIIPDVLSSNNIVAVPLSFVVQDNVVIFTYNLQTPNKQIFIPAKAFVYGFYQYPSFSNNQIVDKNWKPQNWEFLKANINRAADRKIFDQFIVDHWNDSLAGDAINAYQYFYLLDTFKTTNLKQYINAGFADAKGNDRRANWSIAYLIGSSFSVTTNPHLAGALQNVPNWVLPHGANSVNINPVYSSTSTLNKTTFELTLKWELPNFVEKNYKDSVSWLRGPSTPFTVSGELKFKIPNTKPTMTDVPSFIKTKVAKQKITVQATVNNPNPSDGDAWKTATVSKTYDFSLLDALYQYFKWNGSTVPNQLPTRDFNLFKDALAKNV